MRKDRNTFFQESSSNFQNYNPLVPPQYQMASNNSMMYSGNMPIINDTSERLAKIERQIARLDHRITKLESSSNNIINDLDTTSNNMYML